jgi:hypothetical protein
MSIDHPLPFVQGRQPASQLSPYTPDGEYFTHDFPADIEPGDNFTITLGGVDKQLHNIDGLRVEPAPRPKNQSRTPRFTEVHFEYSTKVKPIRLFIKTDSSLVFIYGAIDSPIILQPSILVPERSTLTTFYPRTNKNKVLHAYHQGAGHPVFDIHLALENYSQFFTIDTNCWNVRGLGKVAATTAIQSTAKRVPGNASYVSSDFCYQDIAINPEGNPELPAISLFLQELERSLPSWPPKGKIAIVTDTEYAILKAINERKAPLFNDEFLPEAFDLLYATADAGTDEWMVNRLIGQCDKLSKAQLQEFLLRNGRVRE